MTPGEVIDEVRKKNPDIPPLDLVGINKYPSQLKKRNVLKVVRQRPCRVTGNIAQELAPTYEMPLDKKHELIDEKYIDLKETEIDGGMGVVKFVQCRETGKRLAMKICKENMECRFSKEVELLLRCHHLDEVITVIDHNLEKKPFYFVMPIAPGGNALSLIDDLKDNYPLQGKIFGSMLDCIQVLHDSETLHRDIKPENFLVFKNNRIVVIDLGIARDNLDDGKTRVTHTIAKGGTDEFAPPEFYKPGGFKYADYSWDVYCLAKTFYKLATGLNARFFEGGTLPDSLMRVLVKAIHNNKTDRYQTVSDFRTDLLNAYSTLQQHSQGE